VGLTKGKKGIPSRFKKKKSVDGMAKKRLLFYPSLRPCSLNRYFNRETNVVFIDLSIFNYYLKLPILVRFTVEFGSAGMSCSSELQQTQLLWPPDRYTYRLTLSILVGLGYCYMFIMQVMKAKRLGRHEYLSSFTSYVQIINIVVYLIQTGYRFESHALLGDTTEVMGTHFIDIRPAVHCAYYSIGYQAINTFLNWFKLIMFLYRYPSFGLMTDTIAAAAPELGTFSLVFFIILFGFAQAYALYFGKNAYGYRTLGDSIHTLSRAMLGDFDFDETYQLNRFMGPLFFYVFILVGFLIVLNIVIAIISDAYINADDIRKERVQAIKEKKEELRRENGGKLPQNFVIRTVKATIKKVLTCNSSPPNHETRIRPY